MVLWKSHILYRFHSLCFDPTKVWAYDLASVCLNISSLLEKGLRSLMYNISWNKWDKYLKRRSSRFIWVYTFVDSFTLTHRPTERLSKIQYRAVKINIMTSTVHVNSPSHQLSSHCEVKQMFFTEYKIKQFLSLACHEDHFVQFWLSSLIQREYTTISNKKDIAWACFLF